MAFIKNNILPPKGNKLFQLSKYLIKGIFINQMDRGNCFFSLLIFNRYYMRRNDAIFFQPL